MPASADPRRTPQDPWEDLSRGSTSSSTNKRAHSSASDYKHHPRKRGAKGLSLKHGGASRQRESEVVSLLAKYEASLGRALNQRGKPGSHSPAMDVWALALGVDIEHSKATDRARRKVELEEAGHSTEPGGWTPSVPPTTAPYEPVSGNRRRKRGQDALMGSAGSRRNPVVPEVTALDGFLSDLQQRLESLEGGAVSSSHSTVVPTPASSAGHKGGNGRSITRTPKRTATSASIGGRHDEAGAVSSASLIDVYGIPQGFVANAEEARRQWDGHQANLEKRDEEFLDRYKRGARMSGVQVSIAKAWRGFIFRRKFLAWKGRRQWSMKLHLSAWSLTTRALRLYSGNLKRSVFAHWSEIVEEDRNTRAMGELSFQAAVSSTRLSRQAVVQFFQDLAPSADDLSPAVLRNKSSVKRRILKILFQSWRNAANLKQKAAAQAAFKVNRAVRLHTASAMLWAPEIVSLLFHVWSRMTRYKKAVREEREPPTFLPEDGYTSLPEWDAWVANKGRHLELKRNVIHIGGQIFLRNKFRRWVWFTKWSLSQEDRALVASQHFDTIKMTKVFTAWAGVCRDRGSMLRRITRCWQGWSGYTRKRKKTSMLKKKTMEHLRLLRTGSVMNDITAYARDGKVLSAFAVSKLLLTKKCFGGLALSYVATGRATQLFWLLAWQAWKKYTTKRRRWKWLLYEHTRTEALHSKYAVFRAWSYATGRRYRPDAASLTLSASLPFSTWDRFVKNYVDQGVIPAEQLRKDMIDQVVMQQHTAWWLLGQTSADDANLKASGPGTGEGGSGRPSGRMELPQSGGSGGGVLGKLGFPGVPGGKGPADTDWQALTPALFAAVDECDTAAVTDLLRRGAQVNSVYVPPKVASTAGAGASRKKAAIDKQDEGSSTTGGTILEAGRALDLPPPALIGNSDGTFEMRGTTPLHAAAGHLSADFTSIVITLLHAGACVDARDANGRTPLQVCTSPQTAALLNEHAARLQQFRFSAQELRWGQQVLTSSRSSAGASGVWRYVIRAAVISRLDKLRATLRAEDARADDVAMEVARRLPQQQHPGLAALCSAAEGSGAHSSAADVGLDEREKELIRMKMERLDAVKTIIDREHALHSGTAGAPSTSGGGGGGGAGGSAQDMKNLFHDLDKIVTLRASEKEAQGAPPGSGNPRGGNTRRSIGVSTTDHARSNTRTGKERTADDHRKAFSARRADAASWFRAFREDLARADMLRLKAEIPTSSTGTGSTAGAQASDVSVAKKVLAIVRDAGGGNRNSGAGAGRGGGGGNGHGRLNSTVLGGGAGGGGMLGRGGNTSGTDAFTMTEVNICYMALGSVLDERKSVMDQRAARDNALIERGNWVGLQRAMEASKHGQHDVSGNPSSKRRKNKEKRAASSRSPPPTTAASDSAGGSATVGPSSGTPTTDTIRYGCLEGFPEDIAQDKAPEELAIDVIPTSSSKRCHSASVVLRSTVDSESQTQMLWRQVLGRAHRTITAWKRGRGEHEGRTSAGKPGTFGWPSDGPSCTFGQGIMSRVPPEWWGQGGERVLTLMLEERRKLRHKGATLTAQAKELEDHLASKSENLQQLYGREHEVGTTVRDVAMETKKSETRFREDMERWQAKIQQAHRKIRAIAKRRTHIADQTAQLEDTLANWDTREIPTASERTKKKKSKDKEEEVTPETLRRDIDAKRELMMSLSAKEKQSVETIENARVQLEESRVYLLRIQSILMKYASYNMGKMDTLEREFQECTRQQDITKDRQRILRTQLQALFKRLAELDKAISILRPLSTTVATETARRDSATEDKLSVQGDHDTDEEVSPSTSRRGSNRSTADNEADARSSKRKRSSGSTTGGRQDESTEGGTKDDLHENSRKRTNHRSSSRKGAIGSSLVPRTSSKGQREEAMASLLVLIDENTAVFDTDMCSLDSAESASTASGAKRKNRQGKRRRTTSSSKTTTTTDSSSGGTTTASTASKTNPKPITIPPSPAKEGEADPLTPPAAWPAESTPGAPVPEQPTSAFYASVSAAASPVATSVRSSSPKSRRRTQRKGSPSPLQKVIKTKKKLKASPRGGKSKTEKGGRQASASTTTLVAEAEAAKQLDQEQPGKEDDRALDCPSVLLAKLEEENRQAEIRAAQEAKELAEEEECRRLWDEEDAEELEAWRARREAEEVLERSPVLSKEDTVRLLTAEYDQALKQTFEPERRAELARRIALVEAEQRDKERKAESVRHGGERTSKDLQPDGRDSNSVEGPILDEQAGDISHLLDDPGLGLTREEIETLFDIVDEGDWGPAKRMVCRGAEDSGGGGNGGDDGATGKRHSRPGVRHADRGLILFLRKRGLRRMASTDPLENPIDVLNGSPRPRPALKPELDDYMVLNFVGGGSRARESDENGPSATTKSNKPGTPLTGGGGDGDQTDEHTDDDSSTTVESVLWRGRGNKYKEGILSHGALNILEPAKADDGDAERLNGSDHDKSDAADRMADGDETHLYPRTLGSSVSVLDEKDAVLRTGGQRFAGEDPIRGRLRATDPFLWMGRLNAGTSAISGLIDKASDALKDLDGGSGGSDCDSSDGRSSDHQRVDRMQDIQSGGRDVVGPSSRGGIAKSQHMGKLSSTAENFSEGDGAENDSEEDAGEIDRSCASAENLSGSGNIAVDLLSSTMSAYSQSMEVNKVIAGGVVIEEEEENSDREQSIHSKDQDNHPTNIHPAGQRKGPAAGSGPCPMRASPVNARSAALGSSAKLRNKHTGVGKAKMTTPGSGLQTWCNSTEETTPTGGREDWGEDESQDIQFDVIVSGIARDVASRAPPTPRQSGEAVGVDRTHVVRPSWSAQERASPTRRQSDGSIPANMDRKRRRPRSTPAGLRARTEAASAVLDKRPPWSLPLDSVFAPRVKGVVQTNIVTASPRRRFSEADGLIIGERNGQQRQGMPPRRRGLVVRGSSALRRPRLVGIASWKTAENTSSGSLDGVSSGAGQGAGRRIGSAPEKGFMTDDDGLLADEPPQDIRRCHSASEALLESGLLQEAPLFDDAPGATDGIWSWGWHDDGAQDIPSTAAPRDTFTPLLTPELCKRSGRLGHRGTAPLRKKDRSRDTLPFEKPLSSRAPSLLRCSRNRLNPVNSNVSHGEGKIARPWTTGELADNDVSDGASAASMGGILKYEGGLQNRARSAGGINSPPGLGNSNLRASAEHSDGALDLFPDEANALASSAEGVSEKGDFFGTIHDDGQEKPNGGDGIDGAAVDGDDCENSELPVVLSPQMPRRVSFADEQGNSDGSGGSTEEPDGQEQHRARRGFQRRRMSSIIGNSEGYLTGDGSINNDLVGNDGRRKSDLERCRRAMEIARVAHDLLFLDTRPDGLRPITGTPMTDGRNAQGSGGLYVGLAGLRGFDLSFVGAVPTSLNDSRNNLGSVAARLAASRRLSAYAAATNRDEGSAAGGPRPSSPDAKGASSSKSEASWIAQGFLLDRKPGSLMPKLPLSAGRAPAAEMGQLSPTQNNSSNSEVDDEGGSNLPTSETAANNQKSPKVPESNSESPLSPVSSSDVQRAPHSATEDGDNAAKYSPSSVPLLAKGGTPQTPDAPDGRELIGLGGGVRCEPSGGDRTRREMEGKTMIPAPKVPSGTTVMSKAATAMASLFAPKAAVLWSARDLGVDELVFSVAGDEEVRRPPGSRDYTSRALLAAYKQASPVFEVEASGWSKHDGAVAGVDYPLQPPDGWGGANSDFGAGEKDASTIPDSERQRVWKSFERRPISRAEARALREVRLSRGIRSGVQGSGAGIADVRRSTATKMLCFSSDGSLSTALGTTEDNASHIGSISDNTSAMSVNTTSSSLHRPFSEPIHPERRGKTPAVGAESNASSNVSASTSAHEDHERLESCSGRPSSPSAGKQKIKAAGHSMDQHQSQQHQGPDNNPHETERPDAGEGKLRSSETTPGRNQHLTPTFDAGGDGAASLPAPSFSGRNAPSWARDLYQDRNDENPRENLIVGGVRSGGEGFLHNPKNSPPPEPRSATAPASGMGLGLGSESLFRLNGEADADNVLRAMLRQSGTPSTGTGEANREKKAPTGHGTTGGAHANRPTASERRSNGTPAATPTNRTLWSAEAGSYGICRGNTPGIKSVKRLPGNAADIPFPNTEESMLDIEGRPLQSEPRVRQDRVALSHVCGRLSVARDSGPVESRNMEHSGRRSAPEMGLRRRRRSRKDNARGMVGDRNVFLLSESQSAPSGVNQLAKQKPSSSNTDGGSGGGGGEDEGGTMSESLLQTFSSSALTRQASVVSLTVSSTSGVLQQPSLSNSSVTTGGVDARAESIDGTSGELRRSTASRAAVAAAGGGRGRSRRQQQHRRPHVVTKTSVHEEPCQPPVMDAGGGKPLSGSHVKVRQKSRISAAKTSDDRSTARSGKSKRNRMRGQEAFPTVDGTDDDHGHGNGDGVGDVKTSTEVSEIIAGITKDVTTFALPPRMDSTVNAPLILSDTGQPSSPTQDIVETTASCSTRATEQPKGSPSTAGNTVLTQTSCGVRAHSNGVSVTTSGINAIQRQGEMAISRTNNRSDIEAGGGNNRGAGRGVSGSAATATPSRSPNGVSLQEKPKAGKTSLHYPRQPVSVSTMEMNGATGARPAPSVTDSGTIEEIQAIMTPAAGGGPEESNPTTDDGAWLERAGRLMVRTAAPDPMVDCLEIPSEASGHKGKCCTDARSSQEEGVSSSGSGFNNGKRTIGTGEGTPNSPGCGASSRGSKHGDRNARGSPSPQTEQTIFEDLESGSNGRSSGQPESKPRYDVSGISLPALGKPEVMEAASNAQQDTPQHSSVAEENDKPTAMMSSENVSKPHKLPHISGAGGGRNKAAGVAGENTAQHAIKVYSRPARMESKDLQTTTEALTTHHLTIDELLKVGYDELLDDSEDENDAGDQRVKIRKEPLMIPHGARVNGMAYWQEREAKERKQRRRPRTAAPDHASMGDELRAAGASAGNGGGGGDVEGPQAGGDGQWEDEKEEIKRLLLAARARREAAVARVRAQREQARLDSERVTLGQMDGSTAATATTVTTTAPEQDESGSAAVVPVRATEKSPTKLMPTSVGGVATADVSGRGGGQLEKAALTPSNATISGEVRRDRSEEASGEAPPWKGFTLSDDGEAMLRRGRIPSPERQSPVEGVEDWEYQLIVPGAKDNLVNFSVDTAAVRTNFGKLRRGVEIRQRLGFDEEHEDYHSDNESQEGDEKGDQSTRSASATGDNEGNNLSDKRRSVFSAERRGSRSASTDRTGAMPDILVRRRSRVAGVGDNSNMVGSPPTHDPGAIARASRLIAELEQDHAGLEFPLDVLRRDSEGFAPDNNSDE